MRNVTTVWVNITHTDGAPAVDVESDDVVDAARLTWGVAITTDQVTAHGQGMWTMPIPTDADGGPHHVPDTDLVITAAR